MMGKLLWIEGLGKAQNEKSSLAIVSNMSTSRN